MDFFDSVSAAEAGAWLHLTNLRTNAPAYVTGKDGAPDPTKPMRINLIGMDASASKAKARTRSAGVLKRRGGKMDFGKMSLTQIGNLIDEGQEGIIQTAVDQTIGWENLSIDGKPVAFSEEAAFIIYRKHPSILEEVTKFVEDRANFFV
jgi:hypothetical protein